MPDPGKQPAYIDEPIGQTVAIGVDHAQPLHQLRVRITDMVAPRKPRIELQANAGGFGYQGPLTAPAARILAINLIAAADRLDAIEQERGGEQLKLILQHLANLCGHSEALFHWLTGWLAYPLQNPGAKLSKCVHLVSNGQGRGVTLTAQLFAGLYEAPVSRWVDEVCLISEFNDYLRDCRFLVVDATRGKLRHHTYAGLEKLKSVLAHDHIVVHTRGRSETSQPNKVNVLVTRDGQDVGDRRAPAFIVPADGIPPATLACAMQHGGQAAFRQWLLQLDITDFAVAEGLQEAVPCAA